MGWIAVTFYTIGTGYEREVERLKSSAAAVGVELVIYAYESLKGWRKNLNYKSETILRAMREHSGQDIVFIDADAVVRSYPGIFTMLSDEERPDIAVHYLNRGKYGEELLSGTLWLNNPNAIPLVEKWHELALQNMALRHQKCLEMAIRLMPGTKVYKLPIEYTCIFDHPNRVGKTAVIEHYQASRKYRRGIDGPKRRMVGPCGSGPLPSSRVRVLR